jgi:hypothetical protein
MKKGMDERPEIHKGLTKFHKGIDGLSTREYRVRESYKKKTKLLKRQRIQKTTLRSYKKLSTKG